ncbi:gliding motility lipoprotein GldH precursor [mine drainage metagenome]|uniref:Gliding motility lipoprotein GldH n=1 Tax=mine drainage metagenome TaxID=410659 RepID=A0A1J5SJ10_9ZZZZ
MKPSLFFIAAFVFITSCTSLDVYEKTTAFPSHEWNSKELLPFTFTIKDTSSLYNFYVVLRHEDAYQYKNIWLNIKIKDPDSTYSIKREFTLADNTKWLGTGMDDIIEHRIAFNPIPISLKKGDYTFTLQQIMREDTLQHILNAGIRVEKAKP